MPVGALAGRRVVVTGAYGGIGEVLCAKLAAEGASLALVGRRLDALERVAASLPGGPHDPVALDVVDEAAWLAAAVTLAPQGVLQGVVTAAATIGPIGPVGTWDLAGFRRTLEVNVIGSLLPVAMLKEPLVAGRGSVVTYSGGGATSPLPRYDAYAASKAALVRLSENLSEELDALGVRVNCVAPGFVATEIHRATLEAGPEMVGPDYFERTRRVLTEGSGDSPRDAAELTAFLLSDEAVGITGRLISARWDPWRERAFQERLRDDADLARLRRVDDQFFTAVTRSPR